jgi:hypothetical protein
MLIALSRKLQNAAKPEHFGPRAPQPARAGSRQMRRAHVVREKRPPRPPALLSMREACRRAGIAYGTAMKLSVRGEFPPVRRLGHRRYVSRERFENWLVGVAGAPSL